MRKRIMTFVLVGMLSLAAVPAVFGQEASPGTGTTGTTTQPQDRQNDLPWGLLGLVGLAGLMGRTREKTRTTTQDRVAAH
ncbi:MAG TPA: WGxxGxxG family protein [Methylomirabilota bacterium]|nr:WGxxGxxG family protein [Methylomirabilota bacterium]